MEEICINPKEICFKRNNFDQLQEIKILNNSPNKKEILIHLENESYLNVSPTSLEIKAYKEEKIYISLKQLENKEEFADIIQIQTDQNDYFVKVFGFSDKNTDSFRSSKSKISSLKNSEDDSRLKIISLEQENAKYLRKIDDLEMELNNYKEFKNYTLKLKEILKSNGKLDFSESLEKALEQQNFENEKKISQIYDMMAIKDDIIMSLETKLREIDNQTYRLKEFQNKTYGEFSDEKKDKSFASILKEKELIIEELYQENKKITMMNELSKIDQDPNSKINDFTFSPKQLRSSGNNEIFILEMKNQIESLEKLLEEEKTKNLKFLNEQNEISNLNEEIKKLKNEKIQSSRQINLLSHRLSQQNNDEDYHEVPKLNAEISQLKLKEDIHLKEHSKLQIMYSELIDEFEKSKSEKQFSGEKSNPKSTHSSQNKSNININEKVINLNKEIEILKSCKESLEIRILDFINNEAYFQNKMSLLEVENAKLAKNLEISDERNVELENNLFILENELNSLREQLKAEMENIRNASIDLKNSNDQNFKLLETNEELKKKLEEYYYQLEHLTLDNDDKIEKIKNLDEKTQDFINKNDLLTKQVKNLTEEYETLRKSNFLWENEKKILQEKNSELSEKINLIIIEKEKLYSENIMELNRATKGYQEKIDLLKSQNKDLETKYLEHLNTRIQEENNWKNIEGNLLQQISALKESKLNKSLNLSRSDKKSSLSMSRTPRKRQESFEEKRFQGLSELHLVQQMQERENLKAKIYELERKIDDLTSEKHSLMQINNKLESNLESLKVENRNIREGKSLQFQTIDRQLMEELDYLRNCMKELKFEKERIGKELEMKEDNYKFENRENEKLIKFIRDLETKNHEKEAHCIELNEKLKNNANELEIFQKEMEMLKTEIRDKECQIEYLAAEIESSKMKQNDLLFQKTELEIQIKELDLANEQKDNLFKNINFEKTNENEELQKIVKNLREEMMLQNEKFNDTQKISDYRIKYIKDKFNSDIQDLHSKLDGAQKKGLTIKNELPMNLEKILESYKENLGIISHKDASIKLLKDKTKQLQTEIKQLKTSCKQLNDVNLKLNDDITQTMRKKKYKFGSMKENMKPNSDVNNETKINKSFFQGNNIYGENTKFESQIYTLKLELKRINEEVSFLNEKNNELIDQLNISFQEISVLKKEISLLEKENIENKRDHQKNMSDLLTKLNENASCRNNDEIEKYMNQLKEADEALKIAKDEINRKKDMISILKNEKDEKEAVIKDLKDQILKLNEELDKNKKVSKENNRKESNMKEFREKLDQTKINEKNWVEGRNQLNEKIKSLRGEMNRKDLFNKELKEKLDAALERSENYSKLIDETEKMKEQAKKNRIELDRKDTSILHLKNKLDEYLAELSLLKADISNKPNMTISEFERENKKMEALKATLKKYESHNSMLSYLLKRIYRETFSSISKIKSKKQALVNKQYQQKMNAFSDSIDILKISPEDLGLFLEPNQNDLNPTNNDKFLEAFDALIESEKLDINKLHLMLNELIEERIDWEKKERN